MVGKKTWEKRRSKDVGVFGGDDKRSVTACVFSAEDGALLPLQLIFQGTTKRVLPKTCGAQVGLSHGFHFTITNNHLSNLESMQKFVNFILVPYLDNKMQKLNLSSSQQKIWLIVCWSVHASVEFRV
jgi:hypothetical protein